MSDSPPSPRVFISHSAMDKQRFVVPFATKLFQRGVDVWLDKWELNPGDSLIQRIFEVGIGTADTILVVLSQNSLNSRWVREELDAASVRRIQGKCRLIPVLLDVSEDDVPTSVGHLVWHRVDDLQNIDGDVDRIVSTIFGYSDKPSLGKPPGYATFPIDTLPGLDRVDTLVIKAAGDRALERDDLRLLTGGIAEDLAPMDVNREQIQESLEVLDRRRYIEARRVANGGLGIGAFRLAPLGMDVYLRTFKPDYAEIVRDVGLRIVNNGDNTTFAIRDALGMPRIVIDRVIDTFVFLDYLKSSDAMLGGNRVLHSISPELRRVLGEELHESSSVAH